MPGGPGESRRALPGGVDGATAPRWRGTWFPIISHFVVVAPSPSPTLRRIASAPVSRDDGFLRRRDNCSRRCLAGFPRQRRDGCLPGRAGVRDYGKSGDLGANFGRENTEKRGKNVSNFRNLARKMPPPAGGHGLREGRTAKRRSRGGTTGWESDVRRARRRKADGAPSPPPSCLLVPRNLALCGCSAGVQRAWRDGRDWRDGRARGARLRKIGGFGSKFRAREHGETAQKRKYFP